MLLFFRWCVCWWLELDDGMSNLSANDIYGIGLECDWAWVVELGVEKAGLPRFLMGVIPWVEVAN